MPTLHWIGKDKVINHHMDVPYKVLEHSYGFDNGTQSEAETKSGNKIIHGDNLEALKSLLPEYEGKIKCIYIDPPYNTGNENWVYNDNVNDTRMQKWLKKVVGGEGEDLSRHDKWLCMMYPRLKLLHKLLATDGIIFISIDDNEQANLKLVMDEIFGKLNLLANQVWENKEGGGSSDSKYFRIKHEYIISYAKKLSDASIKGVDITNEDRYKLSDEHLETRGPYYLQKLGMGSIQYSESLDYPITTPDNTIISATEGNNNKKACWRWGKAKFQWGIENDFIVFKKDTKQQWQVYTKQYLRCDNEGNIIERTNRPMGVINNFSSTQASKNLEKYFDKKVFNYSKPVELIEYLLDLATTSTDIILDSFAGSGTTAQAALNLNQKDKCNRKFILIQVDESNKKGEFENIAETITAERIKRVMKGYKETAATGGSFDFYELGQPLFNDDGNLNEIVGVKNIRNYIFYTETKKPLAESKHKDTKHFLSKHYDTAYYFNYEADRVTTLNHAFLSTMKTKAEQYVIYADKCLLTKEFMTKNNIIFKKIPRDITRF